MLAIARHRHRSPSPSPSPSFALTLTIAIAHPRPCPSLSSHVPSPVHRIARITRSRQLENAASEPPFPLPILFPNSCVRLPPTLQHACQSRGISAYGVNPARLRDGWLKEEEGEVLESRGDRWSGGNQRRGGRLLLMAQRSADRLALSRELWTL